MELARKHSIIVGVSFLGATIVYLLGSSQIDPALISEDIATGIASNKSAYALGMVGELLNIVFVSVIGLLLFRALNKKNKTVAISYLAGRSVEAIFLAISLFFALLALNAVTSGAADAPQLQKYADNYFHTFTIGMIGLGLGGFILALKLFRKHIGPRWIAAFGVAGYACLALWAVLKVAGIEAPQALFAPGALFEIAFPIWLIWKGGKQ